MLVLGFFPVLIFAWVCEMTPAGLRREVDIDRSQSQTPETGRKINTLIVVLLTLAIAGLVVDRLIPESSVNTEALAVAREFCVNELCIVMHGAANQATDVQVTY